MSTTMTAVRTRTAPAPASAVTLPRVLHSEWVKLWSLRSTRITFAVMVASLIGFAALFAAAETGQLSGTDNDSGDGLDATAIALSSVMVAQIVIGALGVMVTASEYTTGMIRSSLIAVPRRLPVLWGKTLVFGAVTFVATAVAALLAFYTGQAVLSGTSVPIAHLSDPGVPRAVVGAAVQLTGIGLLGLALGALMRNTAAAISTLLGVILVAPVVVPLLGTQISSKIGPYLPSNAADAFRSVQPVPGALFPTASLLVFTGYVVVSLVAAAIVLARRDA
ncbi:ABC transporter permease [Lentzea sp. NPDC051213]|uniref:ABC transporter permease n=1 Tax=Lentzea sp. NPDC051213 TaxID=3364126 RepID=UPI0037927EA2